MTSTSAILAQLRGHLPDVSETLAFAQQLPWPVDPVIDAYLEDHVGLWRLWVASGLDVGAVREHQEDGVYANPAARAFAVIDGMGGGYSGHVATDLVIEALQRHFPVQARAGRFDAFAQSCPMAEALAQGNADILGQTHTNQMYRGMGAAAAGVFIEGHHLNVAHVGDCRAYLLRDGELRALTRDHSLVNEYRHLMETGEISPESTHLTMAEIEAQLERYRNVITRALGMSDEVKVDTSRHALRRGDLVVLCTDGLWKTLDDARTAELLTEGAREPLQQRCQDLIRAAAAEAQDNIGVVLIQVARRG